MKNICVEGESSCVRRYSRLILFLSCLLGVSGCSTSDKLTDEMEKAFLNTDSKDHDLIAKRVSKVINEFFPVGSSVSEALGYLQQHGYEILMAQDNIYRSWPDGEKKFLSPVSKQKKGQVLFSAKKTVSNVLIFKTFSVVVIETDEDLEIVINSHGNFYTKSI